MGNARSVVFLCAGQGSQYGGMGRQLFESEPAFRDALLRCARVLQERFEESLLDVLYGSPEAGDAAAVPLDRLSHSHPALFAVQYALGRLLLDWGVIPTALLGYSLGELVGAALAEMIPLDDALELVAEQARLVERGSSQGRMLAVLAPWSQAERVGLSDCEPAAYNFDAHFVVAGRAAALEALQARLQRAEIASAWLPVRWGFHSSLLDPIETEFRKLASSYPWRRGHWPLISSTSAAVVDLVTGEHLWRVARQPVRFAQAVALIEARWSPCIYTDLGPAGTLAGFLRRGLVGRGGSLAVSILGRWGSDGERARSVREKATLED